MTSPGVVLTRPAPALASSSVLTELTALRTSPDWGWLQIGCPGPTAAFSRRDTLAPGYPEAAEVAVSHGFDPVVRPAGGQLAAYHEGALSLALAGRHPEPAAEVERRFLVFGEAVARALRNLGVDARLGPVPGEYCPGAHSVNAGGRTKLAGTAQRMTRGSFLLAAVVVVTDPEPIRAVLADAYPLLGHPFDPATVGCVADHAVGVTTTDVRAALVDSLGELLPLSTAGEEADLGDWRIPLTRCWSAA